MRHASSMLTIPLLSGVYVMAFPLTGGYFRTVRSDAQWHESALFFVQCGMRTVKRGSRILHGEVTGFS